MEPLDTKLETKRLNIAAMIAFETSREAFGDSVQQNPDAVILCERPVEPQRLDNVVALQQPVPLEEVSQTDVIAGEAAS